jgi:hypothetical protein
MTSQVEYRFEEEVQSDVSSILSFWPMVKDDPDHGPDEALRVLATWSHLERFPRETLDQAVVDTLVKQDASKLLCWFSCLTFIDDWLDEAEQLDESWDWITDEDAADQANLVAIRLFQTLDHFSLACFASRRLPGTEIEDALGAKLDAIEEEVAAGERFLREQPDIFLGAAVLVAGRLRRYRENLLESDDRLWETTLKHRVLEELLEERSAGLTQRLTRQEIDELLEVEGAIENLPFRTRLPEMERSQPAAAATGLDRSRAEM